MGFGPEGGSLTFEIKDSGERREFESGMVRDTSEGKADYTGLLFGPMLRRWAEHTTKGRAKYPDPEPGVPNWTLAEGVDELLRFRQSAFRHFISWLNGEVDEDHAAAVLFNINGAEYVRGRAEAEKVLEDTPDPEPKSYPMTPEGAKQLAADRGDTVLDAADMVFTPVNPDKWTYVVYGDGTVEETGE